MGVDAKAESGEGIERSRLAGGEVLALDEQEIGEEHEAAVGDDAGFERAQRACGGVAGIDGRGQALALALFVEALEGGFGHDDFAADFECLRYSRLSSGDRRRWREARCGWCGYWR